MEPEGPMVEAHKIGPLTHFEILFELGGVAMCWTTQLPDHRYAIVLEMTTDDTERRERLGVYVYDDKHDFDFWLNRITGGDFVLPALRACSTVFVVDRSYEGSFLRIVECQFSDLDLQFLPHPDAVLYRQNP